MPTYEEKVAQKALDLQRGLPADIDYYIRLMKKGPGDPVGVVEYMEAHSKCLIQYFASHLVFTEEAFLKLTKRCDELQRRLDAVAQPKIVT